MTQNATPGIRLILSTCADGAEAERIARFLVESQLAACVSFLSGAHSIYRWQGKIESAGEVMLFIKTTSEHVERVERALAGLHSYAVPEFLVLEVSAGSKSYLEWLWESLK